MIKNNNKGFVITEVLILSTVIMGVLTLMYVQFKTVNRGYQYSFKYDTVEGLYLANNIVNYINNGNYDNLVEQVSNNPKGYIDITQCSVDNSNLISYCNSLFQKSEIEKIIFTKEDLKDIKRNIQDFDNEMQNYIKQIKTLNDEKDYRIIIKYNNGTFTSMRFNKGNAYVEEGLIAHLDGINNTGNGHSNETPVWKDLSNHGNDAALYNNPTWSNNSLTFDGIDDYGILTNTANQAFPNGLTLETRVKVLPITDLSGAQLNMFIDNVTYNPRRGLTYYATKANDLYVRMATNESNDTKFNMNSSPLSINSDNYNTITTTYDNNNINIYINGMLQTTIISESTYSASPSQLHLAKEQRSSDCSNVEFQNVLIYDRALTENEVMRNYQADMARY